MVFGERLLPMHGYGAGRKSIMKRKTDIALGSGRTSRRTIQSKYRSGASLLMAIFIMTVASTLVVSMADTQMLRYAALRNTRDWDSARYLAEAGLNHAFAELEKDIEWRTGVPTTEFPIGSGQNYTAKVADGPNGTVIVTARGNAGSFSRVLTAKVKHGG